jgi:thiol:disulfide interchange protein
MTQYSETDKALLAAVTSLITAKQDGELSFADAPEMVQLLEQVAQKQVHSDVAHYFAQNKPYDNYQARLEKQVQAAKKAANDANKALGDLRYEYQKTLTKLRDEQRSTYVAFGFGLLLSLVACVMLFMIFF